MNLSRKIENKTIRIFWAISGEVVMIQPKAVENCMKPGSFLITPIEEWEDDFSYEYRMGNRKITLSKEDTDSGAVLIEEIPFEPEVENTHPSCFPCRNCGRC